MGTLTVVDPLEHEVKNVDSNGRVYLGRKYANGEVRIIIEEFIENDQQNADN